MEKQPRRLVIEQWIALAAVLLVLITGWLHLAFNWFAGAAWYFPTVTVCQVIFIAVQIHVLIWSRGNRKGTLTKTQ